MVWGLRIPPTTAPAYPWDSWHAADYVLAGVSSLPAACLAISTSARMALTVAIAEIIHEHLAIFDRDGEAQAFIEASWAFISEEYEVDVVLPDRPKERGPGAEVARILVTILFDMLRGEGGPDRSYPLAWMDSLARHVLEGSALYETWFESVLVRLNMHHPEPTVDIFARNFPVGAPVDRSLFDTSQSYNYDPTAPGLQSYLAQVVPGNKYVITASDD